MRARRISKPSRLITAAAAVAALASTALADGINNTLFLHHFDTQNTDPVFAGKPGNADYAFGSPAIYTEAPPFSNAPGGAIVSDTVKFGPSALLRSGAGVGGRVMFPIENNFNVQRGTIDMWINSSQLSTSGAFWGLWGTQVGGTFGGDIRTYIYNTGAGRTFGAYMIGDDGAPTHWEIEAPIPAASLTNDQWHHVAWEWDLAAGQTATFWDGQLLRSGASSGTIHYNGTLADQFVTRFHIGENQSGSATFPGYVDEFRISDVQRYNGVSFTPPTAPYSLLAAWQWGVNSAGNWTDTGNWTGAVPNASGATATFGGAITAARTITLDTPITVGAVVFDNANAYTVAGTNALTINTPAGTGGAIQLLQGNHAITAPIVIAADIALSGPGTLKISGDLTIQTGKSLDMTDRAMVVDYTSATPRAALEAQLASGYAGGAHNGPGIRTSLGSSALSLGIAEAAETPFGASFNGQSLDGTSLIIRYTLAGDVNLNATVDIGDFSILAANFNQASRWSLGDVNYSGMTEIGDFALLASNFNRSLPADAPRGVPEPACGAAVLAAALLGRRRRA